MSRSSFLPIILLIMMISFGCSKGGSDPVSAGVPGANETAGTLDSLPVIAFDGSTAIGLMGAFDLNFSADFTDVELIPMRTSALGESFVISGMSYFATRPCIDCLKIDRVALDGNGDVALGFWIKHPFPMGNTSEPPTAKNRCDLDLFDVAVVVAPQSATPSDYSNMQVQAYPDSILNADGYTMDLAGVTGDSAAMPYVICYEDSNKNRFPMGIDWQYFYLIFSKTGTSFILYMTMGYGASADYLTRLEPVYYVPEFNRKSAWKVEIETDIWYGGDPATITIDIYDWNHGRTVDDDYPNPAHTNQISAPSEITSVTVDVQGMFDAIVEATTTDTRTNGWDDPMTYTATFSNDNDLDEGVYIGLVKVLDSRTPGTGLEGDSVIHTPDGIALEMYDVTEFATYQVFPVAIGPPCGPISGEILSPSCPLSGVADDDLIDFTVTASSDNSGNPIVIYEVDWDYDGVMFDIDASNTDGVFSQLGPFINPNCPDPDPVYYTVAFRATDSCVHPNTTVFATCEVTVDTCCGPVTGEIISPECPISGVSNHQTVDFEVTAASDNGGNPIVLYEADWNYDGVTFNAQTSNTDGMFTNGGPFNNPNCPGTGEPAVMIVAFSATDSCDPPNETIFATCEVSVDGCDNWTLTWGGVEMDESGSLATDSLGNIFATGYFSDTVDLDPSSGVDERTSNGVTDIFLSKFDPNGVFEWTKTFGGLEEDAPKFIFIDDSDNIYLTGFFRDTVEFFPGIGGVGSTTAGSTGVFVSKNDSKGDRMGVAAWGGIQNDEGNAVAVNSDGLIAVTGYFKETADFNPDIGTVERTSSGLKDMFINYLDSSGVYQDVLTMGAWAYDIGEAIVADSAGDFIVTGSFGAGFDFDPGAGEDFLQSIGGTDIFLAKYTEYGSYIWAVSFGGSIDDSTLGMVLDDSDNIFLTGYFQETTDFDPSGETSNLISFGLYDAFVCGFNSAGEFSFTKGWGGSGNDSGHEIVLSSDRIFITGSFENTADFDPGAGADNKTSNGEQDVFLIRFDLSTTDYIGARTWGGTERDEGWGIQYDADGNVYITGGFNGSVDFDPGVWPDLHESNGATDAYLTKISP